MDDGNTFKPAQTPRVGNLQYGVLPKGSDEAGLPCGNCCSLCLYTFDSGMGGQGGRKRV